MSKAKPIEQNRVLQGIIEYLKQHEQSFPEQIARAVGCNSRNVIYYVDRYPEFFSVERLGGNKRTYMKIVRLRPGALTRHGRVLSKVPALELFVLRLEANTNLKCTHAERLP